MSGIDLTRGSAQRTQRARCASTKCGPPWGVLTVRTGIGIWSAAAPRWSPMVLSSRVAGQMERRARWHLWIDESPRPGWVNMSIDMALLDRAEHEGENWLRLYRWEPHCLSFGRHEPAVIRYDVDRISALGLDTVRRPTGGRSVWHARELTYAIASPCSRFGSLRDAYLEIHRTLREALRSLGIEATLAGRREPVPLDVGPCFSQAVGGEVMVQNQKAIGSAQLRRGNALLQHGSILLQDDQPSLTLLMRGRPRPRATHLSLADSLGKPLQVGPLAEAIAKSARTRWPGDWDQVTDCAPV